MHFYTKLSESVETPFTVPEENHDGLWKLKEELLEIKVDECIAEEWTWNCIERLLRRDFDILSPLDSHLADPCDLLENTSSLAFWSATIIVFSSRKSGFSYQIGDK